MSKKKVTPKTSYEIYQSIRRDWHGVNPVTRIQDSGKVYSRAKSKEEFYDECEEFYDESVEEDF